MKYNGFLGGQSIILLEAKHMDTKGNYKNVLRTISMRSMLMLGGSGGIPPQKNFEK